MAVLRLAKTSLKAATVARRAAPRSLAAAALPRAEDKPVEFAEPSSVTVQGGDINALDAAFRPIEAGEVAAADMQQQGFLMPSQEILNGRAAMIGFTWAIYAEVTSGKDLFHQVFTDKVVTGVHTLGFDGIGMSLFAAVVTAVTMATTGPFIAQRAKASEQFGKRSFGPFTPEAELRNSRAAMMGLVSLVIAEKVLGGALF